MMTAHLMEIFEMKCKFVVVSKNDKFKLDETRLNAVVEPKYEILSKFISNNTKPLAKVYNEELVDARKDSSIDYLVFLHSDVSFNVSSFLSHLEECGPNYDVIGLCGTSVFNVSQSPLNWWNGSNPNPFSRWGCVTHGELGDQTSYFSNHFPNIRDVEVACIDGLCIIFARKALDSEMTFDEDLGAYDFYDTDISCQAMMKYGLKLGVMVQHDLCHYSVGKSILKDSFLESEVKFRKKWNFPIPPGSAVEKFINNKMLSK